MTEVSVDARILEGPHGPLGVRIYQPTDPAGPGLLWAHGGGFVGGDLDMPEADWVAHQFAIRGITVVSLDYRRAPMPQMWARMMGMESPAGGLHRYPVASEETEFAFLWAVESGPAVGPWVLGGASAGGNLAAGCTLRMMNAGGALPALSVLAYPTLHAVQPEMDAETRRALETTDQSWHPTVLDMYENYLGGPVDAADIFAIPGLATSTELFGFPPTMMITSEVDELRISGEAFAASLLEAGTDVELFMEPGSGHGHLNQPDEPTATASIDRFAARILMLTLNPAWTDRPRGETCTARDEVC